MGRHRTQQEKRELGEHARQLRAAGRSRREIQAELGIGDDLAKAFLRGVPLPDALARPRAKDGDREAARALRMAGSTYDQIADDLGVSKSTCSLWLRDLPHPTGDDAAAVQPPVVPEPLDERHVRARQLRSDGLTLREIAEIIGVSAPRPSSEPRC
jgi:orotate phosphoribosyltransferase-like protein